MIIDGKRISERRLELIKEEIDESGLYPRLATVIAGDDPASLLYVQMKHRACEKVHIGSISITLPGDATTAKILETVDRLNRDPEINGILVQLPLPPGVDTEQVIEAISPEKDVDGFHPYNLGKLLGGKPGFVPCTPLGIMTLLQEYNIDPAGKRAVVIGRSIDVGRPIAALLINADATVTVCHSKTKDLAAELRSADIIVSAIGKAKFITEEMVSENAVVIDVGINHVDGKLCGDVDFAAVSKKVAAITPVPGGVGPMTIATLMENTFKATKMQSCKSVQ